MFIILVIREAYPAFSNSRKKGDNGLVGVIGGSLEYTGAPFYSAISALKSGADIAHIFCHKEATTPIKSYSPELIVHPGFDEDLESPLIEKTNRWVKNMSSLVIGPGLGREDYMKKLFNTFLNYSKNLDIYHILDADSLFHFVENKDTVVVREVIKAEKAKFIFTPNHNEFKRFYSAYFDDYEKFDDNEEEKVNKDFKFEDEIIEIDVKTENFKYFQREIKLSQILGNKIIVRKGWLDVITNGKMLYIVGNKGSMKRCGGIGDLLSGMISAILSMRKITDLSELKCIASACFICRFTAFNAFKKYQYSLTAPNIIEEIHLSLNYLLSDDKNTKF